MSVRPAFARVTNAQYGCPSRSDTGDSDQPAGLEVGTRHHWPTRRPRDGSGRARPPLPSPAFSNQSRQVGCEA